MASAGRFLSPDPYVASEGPARPGSWNRYAYVEGDPVKYFDPRGTSRASCDWNGEGWECEEWEDPLPPGGGGGGGQGGGGAIKMDVRGMAGYGAALAALNNPDCANFLSGIVPDIREFSSVIATAVLNGETYLATSAFGATAEEEPGGGWTVSYQVASVRGGDLQTIELSSTIFNNPTLTIGKSVVTMLQVFQQQFGLISSVTTGQYQAVFLLHEIGHVLGGLASDFGADGATPDSEKSASNTGKVIETCFPELLSKAPK